jgi:hypothetical protein
MQTDFYCSDMDAILDGAPITPTAEFAAGVYLATARHQESKFSFSKQYMFQGESHIAAMRTIALESNP